MSLKSEAEGGWMIVILGLQTAESPLLLQLLQRLLGLLVEFIFLLAFLLQFPNLSLVKSLEKRHDVQNTA